MDISLDVEAAIVYFDAFMYGPLLSRSHPTAILIPSVRMRSIAQEPTVIPPASPPTGSCPGATPNHIRRLPTSPERPVQIRPKSSKIEQSRPKKPEKS